MTGELAAPVSPYGDESEGEVIPQGVQRESEQRAVDIRSALLRNP
jgi:hypothetical protein